MRVVLAKRVAPSPPGLAHCLTPPAVPQLPAGRVQRTMHASFAGRCTLKSAAFATPTSGRRRRNVLKHAARAEAGDSPPKAAAAAADSTDLAQSELPATQVAQVEQVLPQRKAPDYYRNAGHRLRTLLNGVGDGEVSTARPACAACTVDPCSAFNPLSLSLLLLPSRSPFSLSSPAHMVSCLEVGLPPRRRS
jgi:hypothetical protein